MKLSRLLSAILAVASFAAVSPAFSQTVPAAHEGQLPFSIGAGASNIDVDWGKNRMYGITVWAQWRPGPLLPRMLDGLGIDAEARDVNYGRGSALPSNFRQDTAGGGPMYTWHHFRNFQPYGKFLFGIGSIDFHVHDPYYTHDTRTVYTSGGGFNYRIIDHLWVRADYDYQMWPDLLYKTLDPQGFTLGATYDFRNVRFHR
jgi:opacity protein-like surface antigen